MGLGGKIEGLGRRAGRMFGYRSNADGVDTATPFSAGNTTMQSGRVNFDPRIDEFRNEAISSLRGLRGEATGNQNSFIQARVNPLQQRVSKQRGALRRSLGRRGVFGSFGNQDMNNFNLDSERALGDARSMATQEALGFRQGISDRIGNIGTSIQQGDLAGLGLGSSSLLGLMGVNLGAAQLQDAAAARAGKVLEKIIGSMMGGGGG